MVPLDGCQGAAGRGLEEGRMRVAAVHGGHCRACGCRAGRGSRRARRPPARAARPARCHAGCPPAAAAACTPVQQAACGSQSLCDMQWLHKPTLDPIKDTMAALYGVVGCLCLSHLRTCKQCNRCPVAKQAELESLLQSHIAFSCKGLPRLGDLGEESAGSIAPPRRWTRCGWAIAAGRARARRSTRAGSKRRPPCTAACGTCWGAGCARTRRARRGTGCPAAQAHRQKLLGRMIHQLS